MPRFKVKLERETKLCVTERAEIEVEADSEQEASDQAEDMADNDKISKWSFVNEEEDDADYKLEILSVTELPPPPFQEAPGQMHLF